MDSGVERYVVCVGDTLTQKPTLQLARSYVAIARKRSLGEECGIFDRRESRWLTLVEVAKKRNHRTTGKAKGRPCGIRPLVHGTIHGYGVYKCRCKRCRKAMSDYMRDRATNS